MASTVTSRGSCSDGDAPHRAKQQRKPTKHNAGDSDSSQKKDKLRTSKDIYDRLIWNPSWDLTRVKIGYLDRMSGMVEMPLLNWVPTQQDGDIPWHRVHYFRMDDELLWDRESRVDVIFNSGDSARGSVRIPFSAHPNYSQAIVNTEQMNEETHRTGHARPRPSDADSRRVIAIPTTTTESSFFAYDAASTEWIQRDSRVAAYSPAESAVGDVRDRLRVITYNVLFDIHDADVIYSEDRYPAIMELLREADADIICLVEVTPRFASIALSRDWVRSQYLSTDGGDGTTVTPYGQLILSRIPFVRVFSVECLPISRHKDAVCAMLRVNGRRVCVAAVHLSSSRNRDASESRAREITAVSEAILSKLGPDDCIIAGDFNMTTGEGSLFSTSDWIDAWPAVYPNDDGLTFNPVANPLAAVTSVSGNSARYDRAYLRSSRWRPCAARLLGSAPFDGNQRFLSDHYALSVDFECAGGVHASRMLGRAVTSAVVLSPPEALWDAIQAIRRVHDKSFVRWLPHINLLYPFIKDEGESFADAARSFFTALSDFPPFAITLDEFGYFSHSRSCTVYLKPKARYLKPLPADGDRPRSPLLDLQGRLQAEYPECNELSSIGPNGFTPHLSVGQFKTVQEAQKCIGGWQAAWRPITFEVNAVSLISRAGQSPFEVRAVVPFSGKPVPWGAVFGSDIPSSTISGAVDDADVVQTAPLIGQSESSADAVVSIIGDAARAVVMSMCPAAKKLFEGVLAVGSVQLGVQTRGSDIDLVCFGPNEIPREAFFSALNVELSKVRGIASARIVRDALVPVLTVTWQTGTCADVQYARCARPTPVNDHLSIAKISQKDMRAMDDESQSAAAAWLNGRALLEASRGADGTHDAFRKLLVLVKQWAVARGIGSSAFGFLGGFSLAVLVAKFCSVNAAEAVASVVSDKEKWLQFVRHFFSFVHTWEWPRPMSVGPLGAFQPREDPMPIATPTFPVKNSSRNVTKSSFAVIMTEVSRAMDTLSASGDDAGLAESASAAFYCGHSEFALVQVQHLEASESAACEGWLRGKTASLLTALQNSGVLARAWPAVYVDAHIFREEKRACHYPHTTSIVVGLAGTGNGGVASGALFRFRDQWDAWSAKPVGGNCEAKVVAADNACVQMARAIEARALCAGASTRH